MQTWYIETIDRDGGLHTHYRHGTFEECEENMWLDFPDHVVVEWVENPHQTDEPQELDFNDMD